MDDPEKYERAVEQMCGEIDALRAIVCSIAEMLPDIGMLAISKEAKRLSADADSEAARMPGQRRRDYAAGFCDTANEVADLMDMRRDELRQGFRIPIIQNAPIPGDKLDMLES